MLALRQAGLSVRSMTQITFKSRKVIGFFLKYSLHVSAMPRSGLPSVIKDAHKRLLQCKVQECNKTAQDIVYALDLSIKKGQVQAFLQADNTLQ